MPRMTQGQCWQSNGLLLCCLILVIAAACSPQTSPNDRSLELSEIWSQEIPDSFVVAGITGPLGRLVIWSSSQPFFLERDIRGSIREVATGGGDPPLAVAFTQAPSSIVSLALAGTQAAELRLSHDTSAKFLLPFKDRVADVEYLNGSWYLGAQDSLQAFTVHKLSGGTVLRIFSQSLPGPKGHGRAVLNGHAEGLLVSSRFFPFQTYLIAENGRVQRQISPSFSSEGFRHLDDSTRQRLVALGTLPLDVGYLQTLADPFTFARVLVTYDGGGSMIRAVVVEAPIGFVASYPTERIVLALRQLEHQEIVAYRWRWVPHH